MKETKLSRNQLVLPKIHYAAVDPYSEGNWISRLGFQAFCAWLQLLTMVDRTTGMEKYNNLFTVPLSIAEVTKRLGYTKTTFRKNVLIPLWNYGLIDVIQSDIKGKNGREVMNLVVYPYPFNDKELETVTFPEVAPRNYATDYKSRAKTFGELGVVQREKLRLLQYTEDLYTAEEAYYQSRQLEFSLYPQGSNTDTLSELTFNYNDEGSEIETFFEDNYGENVDMTGTDKEIDEIVNEVIHTIHNDSSVPNFVSGSNMEPNHIVRNTKASINSFSFKDEEDNNNIYNISDEKKNGKSNGNKRTNDLEILKQIKRLVNDDSLLGVTYVHLLDFGFPMKEILKAIELIIDDQITFTLADVEEQLRFMANEIRSGNRITAFGKYFVGGLQLIQNRKQIVESQDRAMKQLVNEQYMQKFGTLPPSSNSSGFYNWLDENRNYQYC